MTTFDAAAQFQTANGLAGRGRYLDALQLCRDTLRRAPGHPASAALLSNIACQFGDADQAVEVLEPMAARFTDNADVRSALANAANSAWKPDTECVLRHHTEYGLALERTRLALEPRPHDPDPDRPLRVGIVTYDYKLRSSVSFFLSPMLRRVPEGFSVTAYHVGPEDDAGTAEFRTMVQGWRHLPAPAHDDLARQIREDRIDVAMELIGHTGRRMLPAFQPRCAPVQVSYLGYSNTTGLRSMDWRIVDSITDPPGAERLSTERLWRMDPCFICFRRDPEVPPVAPPPSVSRGYVTFGAFSELFKLNDETLRRWASVLGAVPGSRLLLKNRAPAVPDAAPYLMQRLAKAGADIRRVELRPHVPGYADHLRAYADVDIALDTHPYNGTTTVCEALTMGVPIIGVRPDAAHDRHAARVTLSLLSAAGLGHLIAEDDRDLVRKCADLAASPARLAEMRPRLREQFLASSVCDGDAFATRFWCAVRGIWKAHHAARAAPA